LRSVPEVLVDQVAVQDLGALEEPIERIRRGRLTPESVTVGLLLPEMSQSLAVPSRAGDQPGDDPAVRDRIADIARRSAGSIIEPARGLANSAWCRRSTSRPR
jgi:hypothetical protein